MSNSATEAAGLEQLGLCIVGLQQSSASHDQTTQAVAKAQAGVSAVRVLDRRHCDNAAREAARGKAIVRAATAGRPDWAQGPLGGPMLRLGPLEHRAVGAGWKVGSVGRVAS
jgi:hypothetical protein